MSFFNTQVYGEYVIHTYTELDEAARARWLAVVVVWRQRDGAPPRTWRARIRALRYRIGMDPLNAPFYIGRDAMLWYGQAGPQGERETLFHAARRVFRVNGKEIALPSLGNTVFLFLDEAPTTSRKPTVLMRTGRSELEAQTPDTAEGVQISVAMPSATGGMLGGVWAVVEQLPPLSALAANDAEVRAFLALDAEGPP